MILMNNNATKMLNHLTICKYFINVSVLALLVLGAACKSPLAEVETSGQAVVDLNVKVEDHSRSLKRLRAVQPDEPNSAPARAVALESHRTWLETEFRAEAKDRGLAVEHGARLRLELDITSLGEVRAKYILYGIAGGVAWGVGTGLVAHNPALAVGLGVYELVEETAFWIAGSAVFGAYSAPAVVEAAVYDGANPKAVWTASYYIVNGRKRLRDLPGDQRSDRAIQVHGSLRVALDKLFKDLEALPGFPRRNGPPRALGPSVTSAPSAPLAPALP